MLFGHQDDTTQMPGGQVAEPADTPAEPTATSDTSTLAATSSAPDTTDDVLAVTTPPALDSPLTDETAVTESAVPPVDAAPLSSSEDKPSDEGTSDDLLDLKQQALGQLTPLVDHLEQSPEEKFRTTMMMIQSTDNQGLIKDAFAAAQEITDDKARAQALLDIINEINYFTQQKD